MPVNPKTLRAALVALFSALALWLAVSPQPAAANIVCSPSHDALNFGGSLDATYVFNYSCRNAGLTPLTFTSCLRRGTPQYPGDVNQPRMQMGGSFLAFNLYTDAARTNVWRDANFLTAGPTTLQPNQTISRSFTLYGRIPAGQAVPTGAYQGFVNQNVLGYASGGQCSEDINPDFQGEQFNLQVQATLAAACTLGTIASIDFGTQPGLVERVDAAGSVQLTCPVSRAWTLSFGGGSYASGSVRRMRSPGGYYVPYTLYRNSARDNPIAIDGTVTGIGTGAVQTTAVYGRVEPATPPPVGLYQDSVIVTLSF